MNLTNGTPPLDRTRQTMEWTKFYFKKIARSKNAFTAAVMRIYRNISPVVLLLFLFASRAFVVFIFFFIVDLKTIQMHHQNDLKQ